MACAVSYRSFSAFSLFFSLYAKRRQVPVNDLDWFVHYVILQEEGHVILDANWTTWKFLRSLLYKLGVPPVCQPTS
jgi:hypothetical protein